ncbi:MAG: radical SAM protein, partial [Verrucomicrobia bacterium]
RDRFGRVIDYLRMSVTADCNLNCIYCPGAQRRIPAPPADLLINVAQAAARLGFRKIRLTGGEPLLREDIVQLVSRLAAIPGLKEICLTTNGTFLEQRAHQLAAAGLTRVNVSLDAVSPDRYRRITGGDVEPVLRGIEAAVAAGLVPVKLNCVVDHDPDEPAAREVARFAAARGLTVRYIRRMVPHCGVFYPVINGIGGRCEICNRVRFTADGLIRPCLFSRLAFSVRELGAEAALRAAVLFKPARGSVCPERSLRVLGG